MVPIVYLVFALTWLPCQDDVANVPAKKQRVGSNENQTYYLIGDKRGEKAPKDGYGLVLVLPGGDGSADFHTFVKRIYLNGMPEGVLIAQLVAPKRPQGQDIVWPTAKDKPDIEKLAFTTEDFVEAVRADVAKKYELNAKRVYTFSWSSGGPAAYACSLSNPKICGSFIAMSVFKPDRLPELKGAKDHAYFLYHSEEDETCPYEMAAAAVKDLGEAGAKVKLHTYDGGHGWKGEMYADIKVGLRWLDANHKDEKK